MSSSYLLKSENLKAYLIIKKLFQKAEERFKIKEKNIDTLLGIEHPDLIYSLLNFEEWEFLKRYFGYKKNRNLNNLNDCLFFLWDRSRQIENLYKKHNFTPLSL